MSTAATAAAPVAPGDVAAAAAAASSDAVRGGTAASAAAAAPAAAADAAADAPAGGAAAAANNRKRKRRKGVAKRLRTELAQIVMGSCAGVAAFPGADILHWTGTIEGPPTTVYEGLTFALSIQFPLEYPYKAPTVKFMTPCYHPNVDTSGNICLDILSEQWSAAYTTSTVLLSIQSLLAQPNNSDPLNADAARMWPNQALFRETARSFAQPPAAP